MFFKKKKEQENTYQNREINKEIAISDDEIFNVQNFTKVQIIEWINLTGKYVKNPNKYKMKNENDIQKFVEVSGNEILAFSLKNEKYNVRDYYVRKDQFIEERI